MFTAVATLLAAVIGAGVAVYTNYKNEDLYKSAQEEGRRHNDQQLKRQAEMDKFNQFLSKEGLALQKRQQGFNEWMGQEQVALSKDTLATQKQQKQFENVIGMMNNNPNLRGLYSMWGGA
jgi:uncharacterized protein HemX